MPDQRTAPLKDVKSLPILRFTGVARLGESLTVSSNILHYNDEIFYKRVPATSHEPLNTCTTI